MNQVQPLLSPDLPSSPAKNAQPAGENCGFEDVATNVKLLLKLIHDHKGNNRRENYERKYDRVSGMITIIDDVKTRIQKIQSSKKTSSPSSSSSHHELRRCNTELKPRVPNIRVPKKPNNLMMMVNDPVDEEEKMRRELSSVLVERANLQAMCNYLDKEKKTMASQLARKAQELTEMEEFIVDLKAQNEMLMHKLKANTNLEAQKKRSHQEVEIMKALQERNKLLAEQVEKTVDGYEFLKMKFKEKLEENMKIHGTMEEMQGEVQVGINRITHGVKLKELQTQEVDNIVNIKEDIGALQQMLESLNMKISKHCQKKSFKCARSMEAEMMRSQSFN